VRKGNKAYADLVEKCKEDPTQFAEKEEDKEMSASEESDSSGSSKGSSSSSSSNSDSSSSSDSDSDSDSSSDKSGSENSKSWKSGSGSSDDENLDEDSAREKKMLRWVITPEIALKRAGKAADTTEWVDQAKARRGKNKSKSTKEPKASKTNTETKETDKKEKEYTPEELRQKVLEIAQMRGRRQYVRKDYMDKLQQLEEHAVKQGPRAQLYILTSMVSADFDNTGSAFEAMKINLWNDAREKVLRMLPLLKESHAVYEEEKAAGTEKDADDEDVTNHMRSQELFIAFVEKLDDELHKALQLTVDVYGAEYQDILANSSKFLELLKRVLKFFEDTKQTQPLGIISLRLMEQLYYKPDMLNKAVFESIAHGLPEEEKGDWVWPEDSKAYMMKLCRQVLPKGKPIRPRVDPTNPDAVADAGATSQTRLHRRAFLCQAYHLALHDHFHAARDILHLGNLQEQAMDSDVHTQILYNRLLAGMGLCAFRLGKIQDAHTFLMDVCMHNKARELLAQGLSYSKNMDRTPEQERAEKMRQLPYHMHINLEVLESAHHICAMLLEVPNLAMQSIDPNNKRIVSRVLRRALEQYDKQLFVGPPENAKEAVVAAAKCLQRGDWQNAYALIHDLKIWDHIDPGNSDAGEIVKKMVKERIQTEALRTYLFAYASIYDAFHIEQLVGMFGLDDKVAHSIVSKMMIREEITAFWDESSKYVLMQHSEPTPLQRLALTLADRGAQAVDNNERLVDQKSGGYGFAQRGQQANDGGKDGGKGRFGKGKDDGKGKGKGKGGKGGKGGGFGAARPPPSNRGWENARRGAGLVGSAQSSQRGWATTATSGRTM